MYTVCTLNFLYGLCVYYIYEFIWLYSRIFHILKGWFNYVLSKYNLPLRYSFRLCILWKESGWTNFSIWRLKSELRLTYFVLNTMKGFHEIYRMQRLQINILIFQFSCVHSCCKLPLYWLLKETLTLWTYFRINPSN